MTALGGWRCKPAESPVRFAVVSIAADLAGARPANGEHLMARKSRKNGTPKETKYTAEVAFRAFFDDILPKLPEAERRRAIDLVARVAMPELYKHLRQMSKDNYEAAKDNVQMAKDMMDFADRQGRGRKSQQDKAKERDELIDQLKR